MDDVLKLTNIADYAVVLMSRLALGGNRLNAQDLSLLTGIPLPTVSKVLHLLSRSGVLVAHRGVAGGYTLARGAEAISIADIIEAVDGPIAVTHCVDTETSDCCIDHTCNVRPHWQLINGAVRGALDDVKLSALAAPPAGGCSAGHKEA